MAELAGQKYCSAVQAMSAGRAARIAAAESNEETISRLEQLRMLFQAVIDYNEPLLSKTGHQPAAGRRIAEATQEIQNLDREIAGLRD
jgi:hypothetical protein